MRDRKPTRYTNFRPDANQGLETHMHVGELSVRAIEKHRERCFPEPEIQG